MEVESESDVYGPDTLISAHTNKAIPTGEIAVKKLPIFWCEPCELKLATPTQAIQHLTGRSHKTKVNPKEGDAAIQNDASRKRALDSDGNPMEESGEEPTTKKAKVQPVDQSVTCKECNIVLNSSIMAEQHFKGKKHASTLAKLTSAANPTIPAPAPVSKSQFCQFCNITLNSEGQVKQHFNGTRHKVNAGIILHPEATERGGVRGGRGQVRGRGERGGGRGGGRGGEQHGRGRGRGGERGGEHGRGRGRGDSRGRGDRGRGDSRGRGFGRGNSAGRGRGSQGWNWDSNRGKPNFPRGRGGSRGGGVPVGGQYGNGPPPFDDSSPNFQKVGGQGNPGGSSSYSDYFVSASSTKENFKPEPPQNNYYSKPPLPNAPAENFPPGNMQHSDQRNGFYTKDYYSGTPQHFGSSSAPPYTSSSSTAPPTKDYYDIPPPPPASKEMYTGGSGNYYSNGYRSNNYSNTHETYGNKPNINEYQMNTDAMYDSYYG